MIERPPADDGDGALRVLSRNGWVWDDNIGSWRASSGAFHRDEDEPSVYMTSLLGFQCVPAEELCEYFNRDPCGVAEAGVGDVRQLGCEVLLDPEGCARPAIGPAHAVIILPVASSKNERQKFLSRLARKFVLIVRSVSEEPG